MRSSGAVPRGAAALAAAACLTAATAGCAAPRAALSVAALPIVAAPAEAPAAAPAATPAGAPTAAAWLQEGDAARWRPPEPPEPTVRVESIIGASWYDDFVFEGTDPAAPGVVAEADLSTLPTVGIAGRQRIPDAPFDVGFEGGLLLSWWIDSASVAFSSGGGGAVVIVDVRSYILLADLFGGPYVSVKLTDRLRASLGAGGLLNLAIREIDQGPDDAETSDGFGTGLYWRTGLELRVSPTTWFGVGYRGVNGSISFGGGEPDLDSDGYQIYATWTVAFGGRRSRIGDY